MVLLRLQLWLLRKITNMKFKLFDKNLDRFVTPNEWFINGDGDIFFFDIMDGQLVKCNSDDFIITILE